MNWRPDVSALEAAVAAALGTGVRLAVARAAAGGQAPRDADRRNGRAALARLLHAMARDDDAAALRFPHREFSLSHGDGWAVAAALAGGAGAGVDIEFARRIDPRTGRFFLTDAEQAFVAGLGHGTRDAALLRLWTTKEALFKACAGNAALLLADLALADPAAATGTARRHDRADAALRYCSLETDGAWLSLAYVPGPESQPT